MGVTFSQSSEYRKIAVNLEDKIRIHEPYRGDRKVFVASLYEAGKAVLPAGDAGEDSKRNLDAFLAVCRQHGNEVAGVLAALCCNQLEKVEDLIPRLQFKHFSSVVECLIANNNWRTVHEACSVRRVANAELHNKTNILLKAAKRSECDEDIQKTFALLLPMCRKIIALQNSAYSVVRGGDYFCFKVVIRETRSRLDLGRVSLQKRSSDWHTLVEAAVGFLINGNRRQCRSDLHPRAACPQRRKLLVKLAKAGLLAIHARQCQLNRTQHLHKPASYLSYNTPLELAMTYGHLDIVRLLIEVGGATNSDLFDLSRHAVVVQWGPQFAHLTPEEKVEREAEINEVVHHTATNPRRLQDHCVTAVSTTIGSSYRRKSRIARLPLPVLIKRHIYWPESLSAFMEQTNYCSCSRY